MDYETHKEFIKSLRKSQKSVHFFAKYLKRQNPKLNILLPIDREAPSPEERNEYSDNGDIFIVNETQDKITTLEIKQLSNSFDLGGVPYEKIIVNSYTGIHSKLKVPDYHILLSADKKYYMVIPSDDEARKGWELMRVYDSRKGQELLFYTVTGPVRIQEVLWQSTYIN